MTRIKVLDLIQCTEGVTWFDRWRKDGKVNEVRGKTHAMTKLERTSIVFLLSWR